MTQTVYEPAIPNRYQTYHLAIRDPDGPKNRFRSTFHSALEVIMRSRRDLNDTYQTRVLSIDHFIWGPDDDVPVVYVSSRNSPSSSYSSAEHSNEIGFNITNRFGVCVNM